MTSFVKPFQANRGNYALYGFVFGLFGRVPRSGEIIKHGRFSFRVEKMKGARILSLHLTLSSTRPSEILEPEEEPTT